MRTITALLLVLIALPASAQTAKVDSSVSRHRTTLYIIEGNPVYRITTHVCTICLMSPGIRKAENVFFHEALAAMPYTNVNDALSLFAGVYQKKRGGGLYVDGGRPEGNLYVVDGMRILRWD